MGYVLFDRVAKRLTFERVSVLKDKTSEGVSTAEEPRAFSTALNLKF